MPISARPLLLILTCCLASHALAAAEWTTVSYADGKDVSVIIHPSTQRKASGILVVMGGAPSQRAEVDGAIQMQWRGAPRAGWHVIGIAVGEEPGIPQSGPPIVEGVLNTLQSTHNLSTKLPIVLAGISNGGHVALGTFAANPERYHGTIAVPGMIGSRIGDVKGKRIALRVGANDSAGWRKGVEDAANAFRAAGAEVSFEVVPNQGHVPQVDAMALLAWVAATP